MVVVVIIAEITAQAVAPFRMKVVVLDMFCAACMMLDRNNEIVDLIASYFL
jgi:hypothetical protein